MEPSPTTVSHPAAGPLDYDRPTHSGALWRWLRRPPTALVPLIIAAIVLASCLFLKPSSSAKHYMLAVLAFVPTTLICQIGCIASVTQVLYDKGILTRAAWALCAFVISRSRLSKA